MEETSFNPFEKRCGVVTGGNKGIGLEICRQLASNGIIVILTARDEKRGIEAVENIKGSGLSNVLFHQLDVKVPASINSLANFIKTHFGKLDILVNNAGIGGITVDIEAFTLRGADVKDVEANLLGGIVVQTYETAEECLKTNYYGTKGVTEALVPLLQLSNSGRIVNVSSVYGQLGFNEKIKAELNDIDCLTEEKLDELLQRFLMDLKEDMLEANGWPITISAYKISKAAINAYTRILARKFPNFLINSVHPGFVKTDISLQTGLLTPEEGARAPVMLALLPENGPTGTYFDQMNMSTF